MSDSWASTDDHAPQAASAASSGNSGGWQSTDDHAPAAGFTAGTQGGKSTTDQLKSQGFWDSAWQSLKSLPALIHSLTSGDYQAQAQKDHQQIQQLEQNGTPEQRRAFAQDYLLRNFPFASTAYKATHGNVKGAAGDLVGMAPYMLPDMLMPKSNAAAATERPPVEAMAPPEPPAPMPQPAGPPDVFQAPPSRGGIISSQLNPVQQGAVDFVQSRGVPLNAGTVTGNRFVKGTQALAQTQPLGAATAMKATRATEAGLTRVAGDLADETYPYPTTPESAGQQTKAALGQKIADIGVSENEGYTKAWQGRSDPQFTYNMPVKTVRQTLPTGEVVEQPAVTKPVNMPVDVRDIKASLKPIYAEMQWMPAADRASSAGYQAVKNILEGDDFIPAWQAEKGLSGIKSMARVTTQSGVRDTSQGVAASIIPTLQEGIDAAVAHTGDQAIRGLQAGRAAHASKMEVADLADQLREEPVQAFNQMVWQKDTGIDFLRKINDQVPDMMPQIGRAYVQQLIDTATKDGGFSKAKTLLNQWQNLGPQTKALLYRNPALRSGLDNFFQAAAMVAENPNPSGTAVVGSLIPGGMLMIHNPVTGGAWMLSGYAASKLLFSPRGVKLLTQSLRPSPNPTAAGFTAAELLRLAGSEGVTPVTGGLPAAAGALANQPQQQQ